MKVFISHGHDERVRRSFEDFVRNDLRHEPIVLVEEPGGGRAIIEMLEEAAREVDCALILMTADDQTLGGTLRSRQNVVHELGYFQGLLGRGRVIIVADQRLQFLSNLAGVKYIYLDHARPKGAYWDVKEALDQIANLPPRPKGDPTAVPGVASLTWTITASDPTALVRVRRLGDGIISTPVLLGANREFLDLFDYGQPFLPAPEGSSALTTEQLIKDLGDHGFIEDPASLLEEQRRFFQNMFMPTPPARVALPLRFKGHPRQGNRAFHLRLVGRGVAGDFRTSPIASCLLIYMDESSPGATGGPLDLSKRVSLDSLRSENVVTVVLTSSRGDMPSVEVASIDAARFYGFGSYGADRLKGKGLGELLDILEHYMTPDDFKAFKEDQQRVAVDYSRKGGAWAKVPIRLDDRHPERHLRNKVFYPIISHSILETRGQDREDYIHVVYIDVSNLPAEIFGDAPPTRT